MVLQAKSYSARRPLLCVCAAAFVLACIALQTRIFWSAGKAMTAEQAGHRPNFGFVIKLLTYDRLPSLVRCLRSLSSADYAGHIVKLHVFIDHFPIASSSASGTSLLESEAHLQTKLQEWHALLGYVDKFAWIHGPKEIHYRTQNAGLQGQWLEAWWPASDHEFAFMVEDDMCVSPLYFKFLKSIIENYYYNPSNYDNTVYGISLQRPRFVPGKHGNSLQLDDATNLFLYQLVGTWGQLLFPKPWKEFRVWYDIHKSRDLKPLLDGMVTTGWYHRSREKIWTPWFIKFCHSKGYFNLYTHFSNENALSVSYRDKGVNTKKGAGPDSTLIMNENSLELKFWETKPLNPLKRYDFCFHEVKQGRLIENVQNVRTILSALQENGTVVLVNALGFSEDVIKNWLCYFSKLHIKNYVLLLQDAGIEKDLLHRGHAVMHLKSESVEKDIHRIPSSNGLDLTSVVTVMQAVKTILEADYNIWLTHVGTLWLANPFPLVHIGNAGMLGFAASETQVSSALLYIKRHKRMLSFWSNIYATAIYQISSVDSSHFKFTQDYLGALIGSQISKSMLNFKFLSPKLKMDLLTVLGNQSGGHHELTVPFLTGHPSNDSYASLLKLLGFWNVDEDLACRGIYC